MDQNLVAAAVFGSLDYASALALRSCCKQLRAAGYRHICVFSVRFPDEDRDAAFRAKLQGLCKFERIQTLALVNFNEAFLTETAAAITVSAHPAASAQRLHPGRAARHTSRTHRPPDCVPASLFFC